LSLIVFFINITGAFLGLFNNSTAGYVTWYKKNGHEYLIVCHETKKTIKETLNNEENFDYNYTFIIYNIKKRQKSMNNSKQFFFSLLAEFIEPTKKIPLGSVIAPIPYQTGFQESTSVAIDLILLFHEDLIFYILFIIIFLG
jgi:hypothetical protein